MEGLSYKLAVIAIRQGYRPGKRAADGLLERPAQFTYTKFVVVVDRQHQNNP